MEAGYCHAFERAWQFPVFSAYVMPVVDESLYADHVDVKR